MEFWQKLGENQQRILFVGEGNFSFSLCLRREIWSDKQILATCYEPEPISDLAKANIEALEESNVQVKLNFDATKIETYDVGSFTLVVFMFPHVGGKMKIHKNRQLLRNLSISAEKVLEAQGKVVVTLCDGQGGTPCDQVQRAEADTWQITKMMSYGQLGLVHAEKFHGFPGYRSFGYRSLDKEFHSDQGTMHVFQKFPLPSEASGSLKMLYPITYHHDLSFWLSNEDFNEAVFKKIIDDHYVIKYEWLDSYYDDKSKRRSKTVRLTYCSDCYIINPDDVMTIQKLIGDSLAKALQVAIR